MQTSIINRGAQFSMAIIIIVISIVVLKRKGSLSDDINEFNQLVNSNNLTSLLSTVEQGFGFENLTTRSITNPLQENSISELNLFDNLTFSSTSKPIIISLLSGSITCGSHSTLIGSNLIGLRPSTTISSSNFLGLSKSQLAYLSTITSSEIGSIGIWFTSTIYQASMYGNWKCDDITSLLLNYNLTDSSFPNSILSNYFGFIPTYSGLQVSNSMNSITTDNLTTIIAQTNLLLKLSNDCQMRKATLSISTIGLLTYVISSGFMVTAAYTFYINLKDNLQNSDNKMIELEFRDPLNYPSVSVNYLDERSIFYDSQLDRIT
ncbi:uncharacterized protein RJT21DRAFT_4003 [Scheffersomyces amazonensis]|uniref:uncharacterized protein n=1 Tax=Scheffersomyces amazonensis TaxID=1078765 RepID=UPI00315DFEB5